MSTIEAKVNALLDRAASADDSSDAMRFSQAAANATNAACALASLATVRGAPTEDQIKHMVDRFLSWELPENFYPDCGISFDKSKIHPESWPTGTNLIDATQARAMVMHLLEGLPGGCAICGAPMSITEAAST